jgi:virulence-associated protein VagC
MEIAKIFESGNSQAVRLPKAYRLKGKETYITKVAMQLFFFLKGKNGIL